MIIGERSRPWNNLVEVPTSTQTHEGRRKSERGTANRRTTSPGTRRCHGCVRTLLGLLPDPSQLAERLVRVARATYTLLPHPLFSSFYLTRSIPPSLPFSTYAQTSTLICVLTLYACMRICIEFGMVVPPFA